MTADIRGVRELSGKFKLDKSKKVEDAAIDFIDKHRNAFKLKEPKRELIQRGEKADYGVHLQQIYHGVPIWQHVMGIYLDKDHNIQEIVANTFPTPDIDTTPLVTEEEAVEIARVDIEKLHGGKAVVRPKGLVIYYEKLAYQLLIFYMGHTWDYFVDARTGDIIFIGDRTVY